jgi:hypothetical protein
MANYKCQVDDRCLRAIGLMTVQFSGLELLLEWLSGLCFVKTQLLATTHAWNVFAYCRLKYRFAHFSWRIIGQRHG